MKKFILTMADRGDSENITWKEVSEIHRSRNGIYQKSGVLISLLTDLGKLSKCYPDVESPGGEMIFYTGSGRRGDQKPDIFNRALIDAIREARVVPLFCKLAVNRWKNMGLWRVVDCEYVSDDENDRMVYRFVLKIV